MLTGSEVDEREILSMMLHRLLQEEMARDSGMRIAGTHLEATKQRRQSASSVPPFSSSLPA